MELKRYTKRMRIAKHCGTFAMAILFGMSAYALGMLPFGTSAVSDVEVDLQIEKVLSLATSTDSVVLDITPTISGTFKSDKATFTVSTNNKTGYTLMMSDKDSDSALNTTTPNSSAAIKSISSSVTIADATDSTKLFTADSWGYSLDNRTFNPIPEASNYVKIAESESPVYENSKSLYFGAKATTNIEAGVYVDTIAITAIANPVASQSKLFNGITTMQQMTSEICSEANVGDTTILTDVRNSKKYTISKLADNSCWMTQNLAISGVKIDSSDSDVNTDYILPSNSLSDFKTVYNTPYVYTDSAYGAYYSWNAATAGTGTQSIEEGEAPSSICPKGWKLPAQTQYSSLLSAYSNSSAALRSSPVNLQLTGYVSNGSISHQDSYGYYWSSTSLNSNGARSLYLYGTTSVYATNLQSKAYGLPVRCIAR